MKLKNNLISSFLLIACAIFLSSAALSAQDKTPLPEFQFSTLDGEHFNKQSLTEGLPVVVFYFDPDCDHCQQQAVWVQEHISKFKEINMIWVSWGEMDAIKEFRKEYFLVHNEELHHFTKDTDYRIDEYFGYSEVPSIYVFNKDWVLTQKFKKETVVPLILRYAILE